MSALLIRRAIRASATFAELRATAQEYIEQFYNDNDGFGDTYDDVTC